MRECARELNAKIEETLDLDYGPEHFHVRPEQWIRYLLRYRGLHREKEVHVLVEGDGRGTGNSLHTVIVSFRLLNEGRFLFRSDRQYILSLLVGKESRELARKLKEQYAELEKIQATGLNFEEADRSWNVKVLIHTIGDAKWQGLNYGLCSFRLNHKDAQNCLFCKCKFSQRSKVLAKWWKTDLTRYDNKQIGKHGQIAEDLVPFVPMERRWMENLHFVLRFIHDKLIAYAFTEALNSEFATPGAAISAIESEMQSKRVEIGWSHFEIVAVETKDKDAKGGYSWGSVTYELAVKTARNFNFRVCFPKSKSRGDLVHNGIREMMQYYDELQVWPGTGPNTSSRILWDKYSKLVARLVKGGKGLPGSKTFKKKGMPKVTVTPYAHMFINHIPEQYERSKMFASFFAHGAKFDPEKGGLKPFRTDALERENLRFFHAYFQNMSRIEEKIAHEAGMIALRLFFNTEVLDRSKIFCRWCQRGFVYKENLKNHELRYCHHRQSGELHTV